MTSLSLSHTHERAHMHTNSAGRSLHQSNWLLAINQPAWCPNYSIGPFLLSDLQQTNLCPYKLMWTIDEWSNNWFPAEGNLDFTKRGIKVQWRKKRRSEKGEMNTEESKNSLLSYNVYGDTETDAPADHMT